MLMGVLVAYAILNNGVSTMVSSFNPTLEGTSSNVVLGTIVIE